MTKKAPVSQQPGRTCAKRSMAEGLKTISQNWVITARGPVGECSIWNPAGVCIQEPAMTIQSALKWAPRQTQIVEK